MGDNNIGAFMQLRATIDLLTLCQEDCLLSVTPDHGNMDEVACIVYLQGYERHR